MIAVDVRIEQGEQLTLHWTEQEAFAAPVAKSYPVSADEARDGQTPFDRAVELRDAVARCDGFWYGDRNGTWRNLAVSLDEALGLCAARADAGPFGRLFSYDN